MSMRTTVPLCLVLATPGSAALTIRDSRQPRQCSEFRGRQRWRQGRLAGPAHLKTGEQFEEVGIVPAGGQTTRADAVARAGMVAADIERDAAQPGQRFGRVLLVDRALV